MKWEFAVVEPWMWAGADWLPNAAADGLVLIYGRATDTPVGLNYHGAVPAPKEWIDDDLMGAVDSARWALEGAYVHDAAARTSATLYSDRQPISSVVVSGPTAARSEES